LRSDRGVIRQALMENIQQAIRTHKFSAIIVDQIQFKGESDFFQSDIHRYYQLQRSLFNSETVFYPVTGALTRPQYIYVPK
jgi:hypothetical protein